MQQSHRNKKSMFANAFIFMIISSSLHAADNDRVPSTGAKMAAEQVVVDGLKFKIPAWSGGWSSETLFSVFKTPSPAFTVTPSNTVVEALSLDAKSQNPAEQSLLASVADEPIAFVTKKNMNAWQPYLSAGHQKLLQEIDTFKMPVYQSRRSAAVSKKFAAITVKHAGDANIDKQDFLLQAHQGLPFPNPSNGEQAIWNHRMRYKADSIQIWMQRILKSDSYNFITSFVIRRLKNFNHLVQSNWGEEARVHFYQVAKLFSPPKDAGEVILFYDTLTTKVFCRRYSPENLKVRRAFRCPGWSIPTGSDGQMYWDQQDMFLGNINTHNWYLQDHRIMLVPYNAHELNFAQPKPVKNIYENGQEKLTSDVFLNRHINPNKLRYELHRVWQVEAVAKDENKGNFKRRVFYIDEDSWTILMVDLYDKRNNLWRFQEGHLSQIPQISLPWLGMQAHYDFSNGKYLVTNIAEKDQPIEFNQLDLEKKIFLPRYMKKIK